MDTWSKSTVITALQRTKERLFTKGWRKGNYGGVAGPNCIIGAVYASTPTPFLVERVLAQAIPEQGFYSIVGFNDDPDTTFDDVINFLDKIIKDVEQPDYELRQEWW